MSKGNSMNKTKKLLIDITFDMLYKRGYCATSLMDILESAKVTKGAMYYHFRHKNELVLSSMQYYLEAILSSHWIDPLAQSEKPIESIVQQIESLYALYENEEAFLQVQHGCPLNNFIQDMSDKDEEFFSYLQSVYSRWQGSIEKALKQAQTLKLTHTDFDPKEQALFIISSVEGCICSAKAYNDLETMKISFATLNKYIQSL